MKLRTSLFAITAAFLAAFTLVVGTSSSGAATRVAAPARVGVSVAGTSATLSWAAPGGTVTGYRVARDGRDANNGGAYSAVIAASRHSFTFTLLVPGRTYHLSVAARNGSAQSATVTKTVAIAAPPVASGITLSAVNADNPLFKDNGGDINPTTGDGICGEYHWASTPCGRVTVIAKVTGYTGPTDGYQWIVGADTTRTFGCYDTTTHVFTPKTTINAHRLFDQYPSYFESPVTTAAVQNINGIYFFTNPGGFQPGNDMPAAFACPFGSYDRVDHTTTISNVTVAAYHTGGIGGAPSGPPVVTVRVPGTASAPFADPS